MKVLINFFMDVVGPLRHLKISSFSPYLETIIELFPLLYKMLVIATPQTPLEGET